MFAVESLKELLFDNQTIDCQTAILFFCQADKPREQQYMNKGQRRNQPQAISKQQSEIPHYFLVVYNHQ